MNISIYKITNSINDLVYIGSTKLDVNKRFKTHLMDSNTKTRKLYLAINELGKDKFQIELINNIIVNDKKEKLKLEDEQILLHNSIKNGYNTLRSYTTKEEKDNRKKEYNNENKEKISKQKKEYNEENKEIIKERRKKYYKENKEEIKDKVNKYHEKNKDTRKDQIKKYYEDNKDKLREYAKQHRLKNLDKIKEQQKEKIDCICGVTITKSSKANHLKSKYHLNFVNQ